MMTVQALLEHSDYKVTADVYSHVRPEVERQAADGLDRLLKETSSRPKPKGSSR
ncbi:MAG TPA: hypothetical protein GX511_00960 [Firmicutes bacterium]|nr:hypothetical protein [Bacillota bacterium]